MEEGVDDLLRDKAWPPRIAPLSAVVADRVVALTLEDPPGETTHWTAEAPSTGRTSRTSCGSGWKLVCADRRNVFMPSSPIGERPSG